MNFFIRTLNDPFADCDSVRRGRYGLIEVIDGRLTAIHLRRFPKIISALEIETLGHRRHRHKPGNRCLVYYNQPRACPNYLALKYVVSQRDCTFATIHRAAEALDEVARIKQSDALLCDVWNARISDRLLSRWGWESHKPQRWHRHYIPKRFYGTYPQVAMLGQAVETALVAYLAPRYYPALVTMRPKLCASFGRKPACG